MKSVEVLTEFLIVLGLSSIMKCDLVVPGFGSRSDAVVANIGHINIGYLASPRQNIVGSNQCKPAKISTICGLMSAMTFAVEQINSRNDLLPNITLGYVAIDDCHSAIKALAVSVYFVKEKQSVDNTSFCDTTTTMNDKIGPSNELRHYDVVGVVGPTTSSSASLAASYLSLFQVPQIGIYATSDTLSDKTIYEYFLRVVSPDSVQVRAMLDLCLYFNWTYVSFVYSEGSYGANAATYMEHYLRREGHRYADICLATTIKIPSDAQQADINNVVESLLLYANARVVILFLADAHVAGFFYAARTIVAAGQFLWLGADFLTVFENNADGDTPDGCLFFDHPSVLIPGLENYISSTRVSSGSVNVWNMEMWETTYKCTFKDTLNITGRGCDAASRLNNRVCPIQIPETCRMYDAVHVFAHAVHSVIADHCPRAFGDASMLANCLQGPRMLAYLRNISLTGLIGKIQFDATGNLKENLVLKQFRNNMTFFATTEVGIWNFVDGTLSVDKKVINWTLFQEPPVQTNGGRTSDGIISVCSLPCKDNEYIIPGNIPCCWSCRTCRDNEIVGVNRSGCQSCPALQWPDINGTICLPIEATYLLLSDPISMCLLITSIIGVALTSTIIWIFVTKRRHKLLRATYIPLSLVILLGSLLVSAAVLVFVVPPNTRPICIARNVGFNVGINLIYAPLFVKNILIYRIFNSGAHMITRSSAKTQMVVTIALGILIQLLLIGLSEYLSESVPTLRMPSSFHRYVELYCYKSSAWFLVPLFYNIILMLICAIVGFLNRKLPDNFNESWFIFISVSTTLFAWVVFIPAYFTSYYAYMQSALLGFCLILNCFVTLGCQFVPIIYAVIFIPTERIQFSQTFQFESENTRYTSTTSTSVGESTQASQEMGMSSSDNNVSKKRSTMAPD